MNFMRWDPFGDLRSLRERVDRLFEESLARSSQQMPAVSQGWSPAVDIRETPEALVVEVELPGMKQEEIDIELTGDTLTIKGERKPLEGREFLRQERSYGTFQRAFTLGVPIEQSAVKARYRDGLLEITLPKAEAAPPKEVQIEIG
jgi:HSP20 family protein